MIILGKTKRFLMGVLATACLAAPTSANPSGASVRHGQVNITPGVQTQIQQLTDQAIVDWNTFSIGSGESVQFLQPSDLSVILNRVTGVDPSIILGTLQANGNVFLINRNGILFGPESVVNVGGLVASTLNLSNEDFLAGNYAFAQVPGSELAAVVNRGKITISPGGYAVLTGPSVINEGTIVAHAGKVVLASGEQATLNLDGRDLVHFSLSGQVSEGPVLLAPGMLSETIAATLGVAPSRQATQIVRGEDGSVRLVNSSGTLVHSGEINVDAGSGETAGSVLLDSSDLTLLTAGSVISASGVGQNSDGGEILVLSDMEGDTSLGFTHVEAGALIAATGGETGDGGFIEVSGNRVNLHGDHDLSAPGGTGGGFLLDPIFITVIDGDNAPTVVGDITTIGDQWLTGDASGTSYTFTATRDILFDLGIAGTNPSGDGIIDFSSGGLLALTIEAGTDAVELGSINLGDDGTTFRGLDFLNLVADGDILWGNSTVQVAGTIVADAGGLLDLEASTIQVTNRGEIDLSAGTRLEGGTAVVNPGAGTNTTGYLQMISGGSIDLESGNFTVDADRVRPLVITAGTDLDFGSSVFDVFSLGTGGTKGLFITAGGDIDLGTMDLTFRDDINSSGSYSDLIMAGGRIFSSDTGGGSYSLNIISEAGLNIVASDGILLPNLTLTVDHVHTGAAKRDVAFQAGNGDLDLRNSTISVEGDVDFLTDQNLFLNDARVDTTRLGDILLDAGGNITMENAFINENPVANTTGALNIDAGGSVSLGNSVLEVDSIFEVRPFSITAGTDLNLGTSLIDIFNDGSGGTKGLLLTAGGDIDLGTVDLTFRDDINNSGSYRDLIMAGGSIISSDAGPYSLNLTSEAAFDIVAADGILLPNLVLTVDHVHPGTAKRDVSFQAGNGNLDLRDSTISVEGDVDFLTDQNLFLNDARVDTTRLGDILLDAGGNITMENAFINENPVANTTGALNIDAGGSVSLGNSVLEVDSIFEVRPFSITAGTDLNLGTSLIDIFNDGSGGTKGLLLTAGGDIDLGTVDLTFRDDINNSGSYRDLIMAGGSIISSDAGPYSLNLTSEAAFDIVAADGILLPNLVLTVDHVHTGTAQRDVSFQAGDGDLDLRDADISVEGEVEFRTNENLLLNNTTVATTRRGDVLLDSGGDVTLEAADINGSAPPNTTGSLNITAGGAVSLGASTLKVDAINEVRPFSITAGMDLDMGSALIDILADGSGGTKGLLLTAGGDLDLGTVDLTFRDRITSSGSFFNQITASGSILSTPGDGNLANRPGRLDIVGPALIQADTGNLDILDFEVVIDPLPGAPTADLIVRAPNGSTDFGESRFTIQNNLDLISDGNLDLSSSEVSAGNRLVVASNGGVSAILGGGVSVPDIQIFGYNTTTSMPDSTIATNGGVTLGLVTAGNTDLSIFATGDIEVTHTGGGSITAERLGLEGSGGSTSPSAIWSTGGDVSLVSDGTINLGKGPGDQGAAIIRSDGVADVTIQADQLVNSVTSGTNVIDAQSAGFVNIVGPTSAEALEVSAPGISVTLTDNPNSSSRVNIVGDSDFLKVAGNRSDIEVTELLTGNQLTMKQQTSDFVLTVDPLSVEGILYIDESDIALGDINTTADQTLAVRLGNTASISAAPTGFNLNIAGDLLLVAGGNIGTSSEPLTVPGGRTSIIAGGEVNIETAAPDLTVAEVRQFDPFGNEVAFGEGFQSGGDLTIRLTDDSGTLLTQEEDIRSTSGNVAIDILEGRLVQSPGVANPAPEISGGTVALSVSGDAGNYDGTTATPIRINADSLVINGGADVILEQPVGDLEIIEQATVSGVTYNTSGAVGDLRIQAGTGNLTLSTDLTVGGETALVTGASLDINPQFLPNSVFLNNSITSGQNLVILSNGDIVQNSGLLTAPAIGLGANGTVGSVGSPVNIQTNELALNPSTGNVFDSDGFTEVQSVSAVGVTVNQGAPPPPEPEPPVEPEVPVVPPVVPNEPTGPFIVNGGDLLIPEIEVFESSFAQNNPDLVESYLDEVLTDLDYLELDPTGIPLGWYNDDDFLNKKFRR